MRSQEVALPPTESLLIGATVCDETVETQNKQSRFYSTNIPAKPGSVAGQLGTAQDSMVHVHHTHTVNLSPQKRRKRINYFDSTFPTNII